MSGVFAAKLSLRQRAASLRFVGFLSTALTSRLVLLENRSRVRLGAFLCADRRVIIMAAEIIIGLGMHDDVDSHLIGERINLGEQGSNLVEMLFVGHVRFLGRFSHGRD